MSFRKKSENFDPAIEVHVTRGNLTESVHLVDAVVVDEKGVLVHSFGQGQEVRTYPRSAIKMLQALSFVESGAYQALNLSERHLSIACASHNGEPAHIELVLSWLDQLRMAESDLICGPHSPYGEAASHALIRQGEKPRRCHNNCSGKHTGMLATLLHLGWSHQNYGSYDHELQVHLRKILSELSGESMEKAPWGIDGCGIPTYAMSLLGMARAMRHLHPDATLLAERKEAFRLIREAVLHQPYFVGGTNDFCSEVMESAEGRILLKSGAEGVNAGILLREGLTFALKVRDGSARAARVAAGALLHEFHALTDSDFLKLSRHTQPPVLNWEGQTVGKIFVPHPLMR